MVELNQKQWKEFFLKDIFTDIQRGKRLTKDNQIIGTTPYISSTAINNGVDNFIGNDINIRTYSNCLSLANSGSVGSCFYEPFEFIASDHITHLKNNNFTPEIYLFLANNIKRLSEKYGFNREINDKRISREKIVLPIDDYGNVDFEYIEQYVKLQKIKLKNEIISFFNEKLEVLGTYKKIEDLEKKEWKLYKIEDVLDILSGVSLTKNKMIEGNIPFISASSVNNAVTNFVGNINNSIDEKVISVNSNGSVGEAFYHPYKCLFSGDVKRLHLKNYEDNEYIGLFISQILRKQKEIYGYGYKFSEKRMKRSIIMLPSKDNGKKIDFEYMEQYVKNLMIEKIDEYLEFIEEINT